MRTATFLCLAGGLAVTGPAAAGPDLQRGQTLARKHCAFCHVVGDFNRFGGIGSTPSFQILVKLADSRERFQTFFARRPHPSFMLLPDQSPPTALPLNAPPVRLTYDDIDDIVAYALSLKSAPARKK